MIKTVCLFILLTVFCQSFSQNLSKNSDFELERNAIESLTQYNFPEALKRAHQLLKNAEKSNDEARIAKAKSTLAFVKIFDAETIEAEKLNSESLNKNLLLKNENEIAKNYLLSALLFSRKSNFVKSVEMFLKSIELANKNKNYSLLQKNYRGLANTYLDQKNTDLALNYILKAQKIAKYNNNISENAYINATLAEVYRLKGDCEQAKKIFQKAYLDFKKSNEEHGQAYVLTNWSLCYENNIATLLKMELEAQEIWDKISPENLMSVTNLGNLGYTFFEIAKDDNLKKETIQIIGKKTSKELFIIAEEYFNKCLTIAKKKKNLDSMLYFSQSLSILQKEKGDFESAYANLELRNELYDSIYSQKNKNKIAALESEKEIELRDKQIQLNKLTLAAKEKQKYYLIIGLLLVMIIGSLLFYQNRSRKKTNEKLQLLNKELDESNKAKTRFFSILNHDLRGPVANLIFFLQLQKESPEMLDEESTKRMQDKTMAGAENLLNSMEDILQWSKSQMENFKPQPKKIAISNLFEEVKNHFSSEEHIKISFENPQNIQINTDENYLKTIIRNLTGNAIKALKEIENPTIIWKAWQENGQSFLSISDNGKGASDEQFKALYDEKEVTGIKTGLGLHLIRDLAKAIDCKITVDSKQNVGTIFTLVLK
ncbi:MAG TPA: tetratricopeptide repeat-containing sensor histidine kinase [Flavobacterium sp.]|nr:tetratricopeptide repeat-containing sensor histidine kinase [Flavobacterium sp.]